MNRTSVLSLASFAMLIISVVGATKSSATELPFADGDRILFIGDSITQDGRYVDLIRGYLWARYPDLNLTIINAGLSSETVSGLTEPVHPYPRPNINDRLGRAIKLAEPDWVLVCYGMNDGIYHPVEDRITTAYRNGLEQVVATISAAGAKIILLTPPVFDAQAPLISQRLAEAKSEEPYGYLKPYADYDQTLAALGEIATGFAVDPRVTSTIDLHADTKQFLAAAKRADPSFEYGDGVHPPLAGHAAMARSILISLGQPPELVDQTLARIADVRPPGTDAAQLPASNRASEIREALFSRGRNLSAQIRQTVDPQRGPQVVERLAESVTGAGTASLQQMIAGAMQSR